MKSIKFLTALIACGIIATSTVNAASSIGRSGGSSSHSSSSSSSRLSMPSPAPSRPAQSASTAKPTQSSGIGGTQGSMGVRKSDVTAPVASNVQNARNSTSPPSNSQVSPPNYIAPPVPSYSPPVAPQYSGSSTGSMFMSSLGGSFVGSMLGNAISHPSGGTTIVNNGSAGSGAASPSGQAFDSGNGYSQPGPSMVNQKESYGMGKLIIDLILFVILIALLVGIAYLFYKGVKE